MGIQDVRLLRWAASEYYAADGSPNGWRNGTSPTKIEPDAIDLGDGLANDRDTRAEVMNYLLHRHDVLRNDLLLDRLCQFEDQRSISADAPGGVYSNTTERNWDADAQIIGERVNGAFSTRRQTYVHGMDADTSLMLRDSAGKKFTKLSAAGNTNGNWSRGAYVPHTTAGTSYICMVRPGGDNAVQYLSDTAAAALISTSVGGHVALDCEPIVRAGTSLAAGRFNFLSSNAGTVWFNTWLTSTGIGVPVNTGLATTADGVYQIVRVPSGRIWVITSIRAAYSDDGGGTWTFDGAALGAASGHWAIYDVDNARWMRFTSGLAAPQEVRTSNNPNNPTAHSTLKTIASLRLLCQPVVLGRYVYCIAVTNGGVRPVMSPDWGLTWIPCTRKFTHSANASGVIGSAILTGFSAVRITANAVGVVARLMVGSDTMALYSRPISSLDFALA